MQAIVGDFRCSNVLPRSVVLLQCYSLVQASPAGCASAKVADQQSVPKSEGMVVCISDVLERNRDFSRACSRLNRSRL